MTNDSPLAGRKVGLIGLGAMGSGMAGSLRRAGAELHVCDAREGVAAGLRRAGRHRLRHAGRARRRAARSSSRSSSTRRRPSRCCSATAPRPGRRRGDAPGQRLRDVLDRRPERLDRLRAPARGARPALRRCADLRRRRQGGVGRDDGHGRGPRRRLGEGRAVPERDGGQGLPPRRPRRQRQQGQDHQPAARRRAHRRRRRGDGARPARRRRRRARSTTSSPTAPATAGCSRTGWRTCWPTTTRRSRRSTSSSRTSAWCSTPPARPSFPLPLASTAHQMFMQASTAGFAKEDDAAVIKIFPGDRAAGRAKDMSRCRARLHRRRLHRRHRPRQQPRPRRHAGGADDRRARGRRAAGRCRRRRRRRRAQVAHHRAGRRGGAVARGLPLAAGRAARRRSTSRSARPSTRRRAATSARCSRR